MAIDNKMVVSVEHEFAASPERVFAALKAGRLFYNCGAWPGETQIDFRAGGKYRLDFAHYGCMQGEFTEIVENRRVAFTWNSTDGEIKSRVLIELMAQGQGCRVKLRHEGLADQETAESHEGGWTAGLTGAGNEATQNRVRLDREFLAPVELLYDACSGMNFFANMGAQPGKSQVDFRVGGRYRCELPNGNVLSGEFTEIVKLKKIAFTWEGAPCGEPLTGVTRVAMEFGPWGDGGKRSYLELVHEGFTENGAACSHHEGWNKILRSIYDRVSK